MSSQFTDANFPVVFSDNTAVVKIPSRLSVLEAVAFKKTCHQLLDDDNSARRLILDFQETKFIDSSGIGALVHNLKATQEKGVELLLENVHPPVEAVLSMTGLDEVLNILTVRDSERPTSPRSAFQSLETHPSLRSKVKRLVDIVGALVGLGITGIVFIPTAIAIKRDSPGPIFFTQVRCGWMGRQFRIWKFRSMCIDAEARKSEVANEASGAIFKNDNDPRITKVGRFLRRTSLDELPQFWNVLRGEMSLVGTRPPTPDEVERYEIPKWQRLDVKPGMTGEWQVHGRSQIRDFEEIIQMDLRYQKNWSLQYDLKLILKTVLILFNKNSGAV